MQSDTLRSLPPCLVQAALIALLLTIVSCSKPAAENKPRATEVSVPVTVARVESSRAERTIPIVGTLYPKDEATLGAEVEGHVEQTSAEFGDRVQAGQEIARIDTSTYAARQEQAAANVARARAVLANEERNLKREQELRTAGIGAVAELDRALALTETARAELQAALAAEAIARLNVDRSRVRAPFNAAISERIASAGDYLKSGDPLFRIVNDGVLKFITAVPERYAAGVQKDQLVRFSVDAWPGEIFTGKVLLISPSVNLKTRNFSFGALVENSNRRLKANTFARGELVLERDATLLTIPLDAVVNFAGVTKVFVVEEGVARSRAIEAGPIRNGRQEVLAGLKAGETIIVSGQSRLHDGARVTLRTESAANAPATQ